MTLWPKPYSEMTDIANGLLKKNKNLILLASSIVNPRHSIPIEQLRLMEKLKNPAIYKPYRFTFLLKKYLICLVSAFYDSANLFVLKLLFGLRTFFMFKTSADLFIKSWSAGPQGLIDEKDFYYGELGLLLKKKGVNVKFLIGDGRSNDGRVWSRLKAIYFDIGFILAVLNRKKGFYFPEQMLIPIFAPVKAALAQWHLCMKLCKDRNKTSSKSEEIVINEIMADLLRTSTTKHFMFSHITKSLIQKFHPKALITLFEGQPWEKIVWTAARDTDSSVRVGGYQHTVVMGHSLSLTQPHWNSWEKPAPDFVLCSGSESLKMMQGGYSSQNVSLLRYGTHRRLSTSTSFKKPRLESKNILVMPEGIPVEAKRIFNFIIDLAPMLPDYNFILRNHPVLPFHRVQMHLKQKVDAIPNIKLSEEKDMQVDFEKSGALIYRGSSAVFYAVMAGLKPICLVGSDEPNVDPLYSLTGWREYASTVEICRDLILKLKTKKSLEIEAQWRASADFVDHLAEPVNGEILQRLLKETGLN